MEPEGFLKRSNSGSKDDGGGVGTWKPSMRSQNEWVCHWEISGNIVSKTFSGLGEPHCRHVQGPARLAAYACQATNRHLAGGNGGSN